VVVSGDYAYVADAFTLQIIDVSTPSNPTFAGSYDTPDNARDVCVLGNYAYINDKYSLQVLDISDPPNPAYVESYDRSFLGRFYRDVAVAGGYVYLAETYSVIILDSGLPGCDYIIGDVAFFKGGAAPAFECECPPHGTWHVSGDVNGDCLFNLVDISYGIAYFKGGAAPIPCPDCPPVE
jgi:hypothetical protein